jgi:hypothetical protein
VPNKLPEGVTFSVSSAAVNLIRAGTLTPGVVVVSWRGASCRSRREYRTFVCGWHRTGVRSWWTVADPADLAGFDFADRLASAKWVPMWGFASTGHSPEGRTLH